MKLTAKHFGLTCFIATLALVTPIQAPCNDPPATEMTGFRSFVREGIQIATNQAATLDVSLQVGNQAETTTVASQAPYPAKLFKREISEIYGNES